MISITDKGLINLIRSVEENPKRYFWLRTTDFNQQLYISDSFKQVWGRPIEQLFSHPTAFRDALVQDENESQKRYINRVNNTATEGYSPTILSKLRTPTNELHYLKDSCFSLHDSYGNILGMAGICNSLSINEWESELHGELDDPHPVSTILKSLQEKHINRIAPPVSNDIEVPYKKIKSQYYVNTSLGEVALTKRELDTLNLLLSGKTAKETGQLLNISHRVVEEYLDNLRLKLNCRKKLEIAKRIKLFHLKP